MFTLANKGLPSITPVQHPTVGTWENKSQNCYGHDAFGERSYQHLATLSLTRVSAIISELGGIKIMPLILAPGRQKQADLWNFVSLRPA